MSLTPQQTEQLRTAWKIVLGTAGALAGVTLILVLLGILLKVAYVKPTIAGGMTDAQRYELLQQSQAQDQQLLGSYGWMDKGKGTVRLPIKVAMEKLVEQRK